MMLIFPVAMIADKMRKPVTYMKDWYVHTILCDTTNITLSYVEKYYW
jgi:hypothetical protein